MNLIGFCFCGGLTDANRIGCVIERAVEAGDSAGSACTAGADPSSIAEGAGIVD